jgi:hypothetical protein
VATLDLVLVGVLVVVVLLLLRVPSAGCSIVCADRPETGRRCRAPADAQGAAALGS